MDKILAIDLSSKSGWAVFIDKTPNLYGTLFPDKVPSDFGQYPYNYVKWAQYIVNRLIQEVVLPNWSIDMPIIVEETNASKQNYSQKGLEYLHFCLNQRLEQLEARVFYIRSGEWRKFANSRLSKEEKSLNAKIARIKKKTGKKLAKIDGKVVGRKGRKHVAIRRVQELFGIEMKRKDEDAADALLVGWGFLCGAPVCDGKTTGGKSNLIIKPETP